MNMIRIVLPVILLQFAAGTSSAEETGREDMMARVVRLMAAGENEKALRLAGDAISADPENPRVYHFRGQVHRELRMNGEAVADYSRVLELNPDDKLRAETFQARGECHFKLGKFRASMADFDARLELRPAEDPYHWQRGISCYYAGEYEKGYQQFERHQTVNSQDVENAVWHFLCRARATDIREARASLIAISGDQRVPMMEVQALFAGKSTPEKVMAKAREGEVDRETLERQLFYGHLYLALWFAASGDNDRETRHIVQAEKYADGRGYMGDVARVHRSTLTRGKPGGSAGDRSGEAVGDK